MSDGDTYCEGIQTGKQWSRGASSETIVVREASAGRWHMEGDLRDEKNQTGSRLSGGSAPGDQAPEGRLRG